MAKALLFLGSPPDAIPAFGRARSLGYDLYIVDGNPDSPGLRWASKYAKSVIIASVYDTEAVLGAVEGLRGQINGVLAVATDCSPVVSLVAQAFDLPHIPYKISSLSWDKLKLKKKLQEAGISTPGYADFVVKPVDGRGSRGVSVVSASDVAQDAYREAYLASPSGRVMFEEYIPGEGISIEAIIWEGEIIYWGACGRIYETSKTVCYVYLNR